MTLTIEATYEDGVLRPAQPLPLQEHEKVDVMIRTRTQNHSGTATAAPVQERQLALERLLALQLPVADWDQMEQEIIQGAVE
jgi:predicted DNA-binding antitoxin AbrB/MazE fold protein